MLSLTVVMVRFHLLVFLHGYVVLTKITSKIGYFTVFSIEDVTSMVIFIGLSISLVVSLPIFIVELSSC